MAEEYGWGFEGQRDGWHRQVPRNEGTRGNVSNDSWEEHGRGFVDHSWEPGGRYDDESGRQPPQEHGIGGYGQGGGGDEAGYGGFSGGGGATTGMLGYGEGNQGATFEGRSGGYGVGGGGYTSSSGGGTSGIGGHQGMIALEGPYVGHGPHGWERTSDSLRNEICEILTRHGQIDASDIRVNVDNGEVTLEGTVHSRREKRLAEQVLDLVHGLKDVHNRLRVENREEDRDQG